MMVGMELSETNKRVRGELRSALIDLFTDSIGEDRLALPDDVIKAGIPRRFASSVSRNTKAVTSDVDAVNAADEWADRIVTHMQQEDDLGTDPRKLAELVHNSSDFAR